MLKDKVVIVTGASRGIGRSLALNMAAQGAKLVLSARNAEALAQLVTEIQATGGRPLPLPGMSVRPRPPMNWSMPACRPLAASMCWSTTPALPGTPCCCG